MRTTRLFQLLGVLGAGALAACSDSTAPTAATRPVSLSLTTATSSGAAFMTAGAPGMGVGVTIGDGSLVITRAQLVFRDVKLEGSSTTSATCTARDSVENEDEHHGGGDDASIMMASHGADDGATHDVNDDSEHHECGEMRLGPMLVDLPLSDAAPVQLASVPLPEGSYRELKLHLHAPVSSSTRDAAFLAANPSFEGTSVRIEGTYDGQPFTWTSAINAVMQMEFNPPVVVSAGSNNVTLASDLSRWFVNGSGGTLDPSTAGPGTTNGAIVESNIRASFHAMHDDDRDGRDDDHGDTDHGGDDR